MSSLIISAASYDASSLPPHLPKQLDEFGAASGVAQNLNHAITTSEFSEKAIAEQHIVYCLLSPSKDLLGYIKTGYKNLWLLDEANMKAGLKDCKSTLCVLDFYVDGKVQRSGHGKAVFDLMLRDIVERGAANQSEAEAAALLAYDRPSPKMIPFLAKHYNLRDGYVQSNNYTVFPPFWAAR
ncbi:hypothetical protein TeGR_g5111 [Tetraparma gracilis]|jgi:alpha-tubulin N-acetyltransferase 1|uniref:N-acetyltransferase domain-containing protein n=1 Tax=Tetraparma gracilis TaxID=2962635 RepID=A0ABQ6MJP3_9STRA|nr:hypothetical protein TeGR_g5111 [Tetraparma gracilis]